MWLPYLALPTYMYVPLCMEYIVPTGRNKVYTYGWANRTPPVFLILPAVLANPLLTMAKYLGADQQSFEHTTLLN